MRLVATPAYLATDPEHRQRFQEAALASLGHAPQSEPSMAFGDPGLPALELDDEGCSAKIPVGGTDRLWCKRDDYPEGPVFTFLVPSDY